MTGPRHEEFIFNMQDTYLAKTIGHQNENLFFSFLFFFFGGGGPCNVFKIVTLNILHIFRGSVKCPHDEENWKLLGLTSTFINLYCTCIHIEITII